MKVYAVHNILHDGKVIEPPGEVEVSDEAGQALLDEGVAAKTEAQAKKLARGDSSEDD